MKPPCATLQAPAIWSCLPSHLLYHSLVIGDTRFLNPYHGSCTAPHPGHKAPHSGYQVGTIPFRSARMDTSWPIPHLSCGTSATSGCVHTCTDVRRRCRRARGQAAPVQCGIAGQGDEPGVNCADHRAEWCTHRRAGRRVRTRGTYWTIFLEAEMQLWWQHNLGRSGKSSVLSTRPSFQEDGR
jgi:hypothetical protein